MRCLTKQTLRNWWTKASLYA